jgi:GTP-binding protein Era
MLPQAPTSRSSSRIIVVNKVDRVHPKSLLMPVLEAYGTLRSDVVAVIPVSALKGDGLERILTEVEKHLPEGPPLYDPEEISDKPLRFFVAEFVREQILRRTRQEVPHGVAVTVDTFDEGKKGTRIAVTIHVAKESHKGIIIGDGGKMLGAIGKAARERTERLLGSKVHLTTFVRATPGWFDDPKKLAELGYEGDLPKKKKNAS